MKRIILTDDFMNGLKPLNPELHSESDIYVKDKILYKIFNGEGYKPRELSSYLRKKEKKIEIISELKNFPHVIFSQDKLFKINGKIKLFCGYSMDCLDSSIILKEASHYLDIKVFIQLLSRISITLKKIHRRGEDLKGDRIALLTKDYSSYRNVRLKINRNFDRLTFLLYFLESVFEKSIIEVSMYEYDEMSERVNILRDLRNLIIKLKKNEGTVPFVLYLHKVINGSNKTLKKVS